MRNLNKYKSETHMQKESMQTTRRTKIINDADQVVSCNLK